jgi:hypothetical protein
MDPTSGGPEVPAGEGAGASPGLASPPPIETAAIRALVERAITDQAALLVLPAEVRAGHLSDAERLALRTRIRDALSGDFAGALLEKRLLRYREWADRIAVSATEPHLLAYRVADLALEAPLVVRDGVIVSGTYALWRKERVETAEGTLVTYGGTSTIALTVQLSHTASGWRITQYSERPEDYERDRSIESNLDAVR